MTPITSECAPPALDAIVHLSQLEVLTIFASGFLFGVWVMYEWGRRRQR